ncbi:hypothetical protein B0H10DRAFT_2061558 [Mycena sp. CBHHK59/15]|nr:hypothetical protein B0H10DRAFT_2064298 [Mycena sp. CBHHK59/15]KAJ6610155.1 hypothetical protein B0H10DRAFT_2061558 [Mycena sp. CBHHK59/15]
MNDGSIRPIFYSYATAPESPTPTTMLFMYILAAAMASVTLATPYYEPPSLTVRQACAGQNLNCTCRCTCGEGYICCCD